MTDSLVRIAIDAMGGDLGPGEVVRGVIQAAAAPGGERAYVLVGDEAVLRAELGRAKSAPASISIRHASQIIEMNDKPSEAYRRKPDASVVVAARLVKNGEADGFLSIGNTGAAMAAGLLSLRTIQGIDRPAIATTIPSLTGQVVLLDAGANVDCGPRHLVQFAIMGQAYARFVLGKELPTVGLLSNGEEESKGNEVTRQAYALLRSSLPGFVGYIEGTDVFRGKADVVVCDGFDGNIVLKTGEGVAELVLRIMKEELTRHTWMRVWLLPLVRSLRRLRGRLDYREFGGAPLLGVNGVCVVGHGRSDARAVATAIRVTEVAIRSQLVREIEREIGRLAVATSAPLSVSDAV